MGFNGLAGRFACLSGGLCQSSACKAGRYDMAVLMDDQGVAQRILDHIAQGTTDLGDDVWREPVENYRCQERLAAEIAVLRRVPSVFCPSAALAEPGAYIAREAAGVPLVVVRGQDG